MDVVSNVGFTDTVRHETHYIRFHKLTLLIGVTKSWSLTRIKININMATCIFLTPPLRKKKKKKKNPYTTLW